MRRDGNRERIIKKFRLSKNHLLSLSAAGGFRIVREKELGKAEKKSLAQDQFAGFFKFMGANFILIPVKKLEKLFIAPKARRGLHETA